MRLLILSLLLSISMILTSCGGSSGSSSLKEARISLNVEFENARSTESGFFVSNTEINSVVLSYTNNADSSGSLDITSAASGGNVRLTDLVIDTTYVFTVNAYGVGNVQACTGSASVLVAPDVVNEVSLDCVFEDELAMENTAYDLVSLITSGSAGTTDISQYVAQDFGTLDGMPRSEFIADLLEDPGFSFTDSSVKLSKVDIVMADERSSERAARAAGQEAFVYFYFSDGSVVDEHIWMAEENGRWVITGNDRVYESELRASAYFLIGTENSPIYGENGLNTFYSGLSSDFYDPDGRVQEIRVTGPGLSQPYVFTPYDCTDCDSFYISSPVQENLGYGLYDNFINVYDSTLNNPSALVEDGVYNIATTYTGSTSDNYSMTVYGRPAALSSLNEGYFVMITSPTSQTLSDYAGRTVTFQYTKPSAFGAKYIEYDFEASDYYGEWYDMEGLIPLNSNSFTLTFPSDMGFVPAEARMTLTAYDADGRSFSTVVVLDAYGEDPGPGTDVSDSMIASLETFNASDISSVAAVFASAGDASVQGVLGAVSAAAAAGLTAADVREAADEAGLRKPASGTALDAYNQLVSAFAAVYTSGNNGTITAMQNIIRHLTDAKLQALASMANEAAAAGYGAVAAAFQSAIDSGGDFVNPAPVTDADLLAQDLGSITLDEILGDNESAAHITMNLEPMPTLPNGTTLTWVSDNPEVIANNGTVTRPYYGFGDAPANLTVTATLNSATETFTYSFYVAEEELINPAYPAEAEAFITDLVTTRSRVDYSAYVDTDMVYHSGKTRDAFISDGMPYSTDYEIENFNIYAQVSESEFIVSFNQVFPDERRIPRILWVKKKEDSYWYLTGNEWKFSRKTRVVANEMIDAAGSKTYSQGLEFYAEDLSGQGIKMIVVTGPGLPAEGVKLLPSGAGDFDLYMNGVLTDSNKYYLSDDGVEFINQNIAYYNMVRYYYKAYTDVNAATMEPVGTPLQTIKHNLFQGFDNTSDLSAEPARYFITMTGNSGFDEDSMMQNQGVDVTFVLPTDREVLYGYGEITCETVYGEKIEAEEMLPLNGDPLHIYPYDFYDIDFSTIKYCEVKLEYYESGFRKYRVFYGYDLSAGVAGITFLEMPFEMYRDTGSAVYLDSTEIGSIDLEVTDSSNSTVTLHPDMAGFYAIPDLTDGETYDITLTIYKPDNTTVLCTGTDSVTHSTSGSQQAFIDCQFPDSDAINNAIFAMVSKLYNAYDISYDNIDKYFAVNFGIYDGQSREEMINGFLEDAYEDDIFRFDQYVELEKVVATQLSVDANDVSEILAEFHFSDGTVDSTRLFMTKETGQWVLTGNDRNYEIAMEPVAVYEITRNSSEFKSGIFADFYDQNDRVSSISVNTAAGFSSAYTLEPEVCMDCDSFEVVSPEKTFLIPHLSKYVMELDAYASNDTPITDPQFSVATTYADTTSDTNNYKVYGTLIPVDALNAGYFLKMEPTFSSNLYHYEAGYTSYGFTRPTEYTVSKIELEIALWDNMSNFYSDEMLISNDKDYFMVDLINMAGFYPEGGYLYITAYDSEGKEYMTVYELYYDDTEPYNNMETFLNYARSAAYSIYPVDAEYFDDGSFVSCGVAIDDVNTTINGAVVIGDDADGVHGYIFTAPSDSMTQCYAVSSIQSEVSLSAGSTYFVGESAADKLIVALVDESGTVSWSKTYDDSYANTFSVKDAKIINGEKLLVLISITAGPSEPDNAVLVEIDPEGSIIGQYEIALGSAYVNGKLRPKGLFVDDSDNILITGSFIDDSAGVNKAMVIKMDLDPLSYDIYATTNIKGTDDTTLIDSEFEAAALDASGNLILSGYAVDSSLDQYEGDLVVSKFNTSNGTFYNSVFNNFSVGGMTSSLSFLASTNDRTGFYVSSNIDYETGLLMKFDFSGTELSPVWAGILNDAVNSIFITRIANDGNDNIVLIGDTQPYDQSEYAGVMAGMVSADGKLDGAALPGIGNVSIRNTYTGFYDTDALVYQVSGGVNFEVILSDAGNQLTPVTLTEGDMLPLNQ